MNVTKYQNKTVTRTLGLARLEEGEAPFFSDPREVTQLIADLSYGWGCQGLILRQEEVAGDFFRLSTGLAGHVLEKFVNYHTPLALIGDFAQVQSPALAAFIRESNRAGNILFVESLEEALERMK